MGALHQFEKTSMTPAKMVRVKDYQANTGTLQASNNSCTSGTTHQEIMQEANERLNIEVQRLKKALFDANKSEQVNPSNLEADKKAIAEKYAEKYAAKIRQLETQCKAEEKKNKVLSIKMAKLEGLLDDVYEAEQQNTLETDDIKNIKKINQQLESLLSKLKV